MRIYLIHALEPQDIREFHHPIPETGRVRGRLYLEDYIREFQKEDWTQIDRDQFQALPAMFFALLPTKKLEGMSTEQAGWITHPTINNQMQGFNAWTEEEENEVNLFRHLEAERAKAQSKGPLSFSKLDINCSRIPAEVQGEEPPSYSDDDIFDLMTANPAILPGVPRVRNHIPALGTKIHSWQPYHRQALDARQTNGITVLQWQTVKENDVGDFRLNYLRDKVVDSFAAEHVRGITKDQAPTFPINRISDERIGWFRWIDLLPDNQTATLPPLLFSSLWQDGANPPHLNATHQARYLNGHQLDIANKAQTQGIVITELSPQQRTHINILNCSPQQFAQIPNDEIVGVLTSMQYGSTVAEQLSRELTQALTTNQPDETTDHVAQILANYNAQNIIQSLNGDYLSPNLIAALDAADSLDFLSTGNNGQRSKLQKIHFDVISGHGIGQIIDDVEPEQVPYLTNNHLDDISFTQGYLLGLRAQQIENMASSQVAHIFAQAEEYGVLLHDDFLKVLRRDQLVDVRGEHLDTQYEDASRPFPQESPNTISALGGPYIYTPQAWQNVAVAQLQSADFQQIDPAHLPEIHLAACKYITAENLDAIFAPLAADENLPDSNAPLRRFGQRLGVTPDAPRYHQLENMDFNFIRNATPATLGQLFYGKIQHLPPQRQQDLINVLTPSQAAEIVRLSLIHAQTAAPNGLGLATSATLPQELITFISLLDKKQAEAVRRIQFDATMQGWLGEQLAFVGQTVPFIPDHTRKSAILDRQVIGSAVYTSVYATATPMVVAAAAAAAAAAAVHIGASPGVAFAVGSSVRTLLTDTQIVNGAVNPGWDVLAPQIINAVPTAGITRTSQIEIAAAAASAVAAVIANTYSPRPAGQVDIDKQILLAFNSVLATEEGRRIELAQRRKLRIEVTGWAKQGDDENTAHNIHNFNVYQTNSISLNQLRLSVVQQQLQNVQMPWLERSQVQVLDFGPAPHGLHEDRLTAMRDEQFEWLSPRQVYDPRAPGHAMAVTHVQVIAANPERFKKINPVTLAQFCPAGVNDVPDQLSELYAVFGEHVGENQLKELTYGGDGQPHNQMIGLRYSPGPGWPTMLKTIPAEKYKWFNGYQLHTLSQEVDDGYTAPLLTTVLEDQIAKTDPKAFAETDPGLMRVLPPHLLMALTPAHWHELSITHLNNIPLNQWPCVEPDQIKRIKHLINPNNTREKLNPEILAHLTGPQSSALPPSVVAELTQEYADRLPPTFFANMTPEQKAAYPRHLLGRIRQDQFILVKSVTGWPLDTISKFNIDLVVSWADRPCNLPAGNSVDDIETLKTSQRYSPRYLYDDLSADHLKEFSPFVVVNLPKLFFQRVSATTFAGFENAHLYLLSNYQREWLEEDPQRDHLPANERNPRALLDEEQKQVLDTPRPKFEPLQGTNAVKEFYKRWLRKTGNSDELEPEDVKVLQDQIGTYPQKAEDISEAKKALREKNERDYGFAYAQQFEEVMSYKDSITLHWSNRYVWGPARAFLINATQTWVTWGILTPAFDQMFFDSKYGKKFDPKIFKHQMHRGTIQTIGATIGYFVCFNFIVGVLNGALNFKFTKTDATKLEPTPASGMNMDDDLYFEKYLQAQQNRLQHPIKALGCGWSYSPTTMITTLSFIAGGFAVGKMNRSFPQTYVMGGDFKFLGFTLKGLNLLSGSVSSPLSGGLWGLLVYMRALNVKVGGNFINTLTDYPTKDHWGATNSLIDQWKWLSEGANKGRQSTVVYEKFRNLTHHAGSAFIYSWLCYLGIALTRWHTANWGSYNYEVPDPNETNPFKVKFKNPVAPYFADAYITWAACLLTGFFFNFYHFRHINQTSFQPLGAQTMKSWLELTTLFVSTADKQQMDEKSWVPNKGYLQNYRQWSDWTYGQPRKDDHSVIGWLRRIYGGISNFSELLDMGLGQIWYAATRTAVYEPLNILERSILYTFISARPGLERYLVSPRAMPRAADMRVASDSDNTPGGMGGAPNLPTATPPTRGVLGTTGAPRNFANFWRNFSLGLIDGAGERGQFLSAEYHEAANQWMAQNLPPRPRDPVLNIRHGQPPTSETLEMQHINNVFQEINNGFAESGYGFGQERKEPYRFFVRDKRTGEHLYADLDAGVEEAPPSFVDIFEALAQKIIDHEQKQQQETFDAIDAMPAEQQEELAKIVETMKDYLAFKQKNPDAYRKFLEANGITGEIPDIAPQLDGTPESLRAVENYTKATSLEQDFFNQYQRKRDIEEALALKKADPDYAELVDIDELTEQYGEYLKIVAEAGYTSNMAEFLRTAKEYKIEERGAASKSQPLLDKGVTNLTFKFEYFAEDLINDTISAELARLKANLEEFERGAQKGYATVAHLDLDSLEAEFKMRRLDLLAGRTVDEACTQLLQERAKHFETQAATYEMVTGKQAFIDEVVNADLDGSSVTVLDRTMVNDHFWQSYSAFNEARMSEGKNSGEFPRDIPVETLKDIISAQMDEEAFQAWKVKNGHSTETPKIPQQMGEIGTAASVEKVMVAAQEFEVAKQKNQALKQQFETERRLDRQFEQWSQVNSSKIVNGFPHAELWRRKYEEFKEAAENQQRVTFEQDFVDTFTDWLDAQLNGILPNFNDFTKEFMEERVRQEQEKLKADVQKEKNADPLYIELLDSHPKELAALHLELERKRSASGEVPKVLLKHVIKERSECFMQALEAFEAAGDTNGFGEIVENARFMAMYEKLMLARSEYLTERTRYEEITGKSAFEEKDGLRVHSDEFKRALAFSHPSEAVFVDWVSENGKMNAQGSINAQLANEPHALVEAARDQYLLEQNIALEDLQKTGWDTRLFLDVLRESNFEFTEQMEGGITKCRMIARDKTTQKTYSGPSINSRDLIKSDICTQRGTETDLRMTALIALATQHQEIGFYLNQAREKAQEITEKLESLNTSVGATSIPENAEWAEHLPKTIPSEPGLFASISKSARNLLIGKNVETALMTNERTSLQGHSLYVMLDDCWKKAELPMEGNHPFYHYPEVHKLYEASQKNAQSGVITYPEQIITQYLRDKFGRELTNEQRDTLDRFMNNNLALREEDFPQEEVQKAAELQRQLKRQLQHQEQVSQGLLDRTAALIRGDAEALKGYNDSLLAGFEANYFDLKKLNEAALAKGRDEENQADFVARHEALSEGHVEALKVDNEFLLNLMELGYLDSETLDEIILAGYEDERGVRPGLRNALSDGHTEAVKVHIELLLTLLENGWVNHETLLKAALAMDTEDNLSGRYYALSNDEAETLKAYDELLLTLLDKGLLKINTLIETVLMQKDKYFDENPEDFSARQNALFDDSPEAVKADNAFLLALFDKLPENEHHRLIDIALAMNSANFSARFTLLSGNNVGDVDNVETLKAYDELLLTLLDKGFLDSEKLIDTVLMQKDTYLNDDPEEYSARQIALFNDDPEAVKADNAFLLALFDKLPENEHHQLIDIALAMNSANFSARFTLLSEGNVDNVEALKAYDELLLTLLDRGFLDSEKLIDTVLMQKDTYLNDDPEEYSARQIALFNDDSEGVKADNAFLLALFDKLPENEHHRLIDIAFGMESGNLSARFTLLCNGYGETLKAYDELLLTLLNKGILNSETLVDTVFLMKDGNGYSARAHALDFNHAEAVKADNEFLLTLREKNFLSNDQLKKVFASGVPPLESDANDETKATHQEYAKGIFEAHKKGWLTETDLQELQFDPNWLNKKYLEKSSLSTEQQLDPISAPLKIDSKGEKPIDGAQPTLDKPPAGSEASSSQASPAPKEEGVAKEMEEQYAERTKEAEVHSQILEYVLFKHQYEKEYKAIKTSPEESETSLEDELKRFRAIENEKQRLSKILGKSPRNVDEWEKPEHLAELCGRAHGLTDPLGSEFGALTNYILDSGEFDSPLQSNFITAFADKLATTNKIGDIIERCITSNHFDAEQQKNILMKAYPLATDMQQLSIIDRVTKDKSPLEADKQIDILRVATRETNQTEHLDAIMEFARNNPLLAPEQKSDLFVTGFLNQDATEKQRDSLIEYVFSNDSPFNVQQKTGILENLSRGSQHIEQLDTIIQLATSDKLTDDQRSLVFNAVASNNSTTKEQQGRIIDHVTGPNSTVDAAQQTKVLASIAGHSQHIEPLDTIIQFACTSDKLTDDQRRLIFNAVLRNNSTTKEQQGRIIDHIVRPDSKIEIMHQANSIQTAAQYSQHAECIAKTIDFAKTKLVIEPDHSTSIFAAIFLNKNASEAQQDSIIEHLLNPPPTPQQLTPLQEAGIVEVAVGNSPYPQCFSRSIELCLTHFDLHSTEQIGILKAAIQNPLATANRDLQVDVNDIKLKPEQQANILQKAAVACKPEEIERLVKIFSAVRKNDDLNAEQKIDILKVLYPKNEETQRELILTHVTTSPLFSDQQKTDILKLAIATYKPEEIDHSCRVIDFVNRSSMDSHQKASLVHDAYMQKGVFNKVYGHSLPLEEQKTVMEKYGSLMIDVFINNNTGFKEEEKVQILETVARYTQTETDLQRISRYTTDPASQLNDQSRVAILDELRLSAQTSNNQTVLNEIASYINKHPVKESGETLSQSEESFSPDRTAPVEVSGQVFAQRQTIEMLKQEVEGNEQKILELEQETETLNQQLQLMRAQLEQLTQNQILLMQVPTHAEGDRENLGNIFGRQSTHSSNGSSRKELNHSSSESSSDPMESNGTTSLPGSGKVEPKGVCANSGLIYTIKKFAAKLKPRKLFRPGEKTAISKQFDKRKVTSKPQILTTSDRIETGWMALGQRKDGSVIFEKPGNESRIDIAILPGKLVKEKFPIGKEVTEPIPVAPLMTEEHDLQAELINSCNALKDNQKNADITGVKFHELSKEPKGTKGKLILINPNDGTGYFRVREEKQQREARIVRVPSDLMKTVVVKVGGKIDISLIGGSRSEEKLPEKIMSPKTRKK